MKSIKPLAGIILIFVLGGACGSLTTYWVSRSHYSDRLSGAHHSREDKLVAKLTTRLALDGGQQEQVRAIIRETHDKIGQIRQRMHPEIEALLNESQKKINALLRPDQQVKFKAIIEERKARRHGEHHHGRERAE